MGIAETERCTILDLTNAVPLEQSPGIQRCGSYGVHRSAWQSRVHQEMSVIILCGGVQAIHAALIGSCAVMDGVLTGPLAPHTARSMRTGA